MTDEFICRAWGRVGWKRKSLPLGVDSGEARVYKNKIKRDIEVFLLARTLLLLLLLLFLLSSGNGLSGKEACTQCTRTHTHTRAAPRRPSQPAAPTTGRTAGAPARGHLPDAGRPALASTSPARSCRRCSARARRTRQRRRPGTSGQQSGTSRERRTAERVERGGRMRVRVGAEVVTGGRI